jgi:long-chain acyl-CoA synthetase
VTVAPTPVAVDPLPHVARGVTYLRRIGALEGDRVVVALGNDVSTFGLLAAACLEGVVAVPLPPDLSATEVMEVVEDARPVEVVATPKLAARLDGSLADPRRGTEGRAMLHAVTLAELAALPGTDPSASWPRTRPMAYTSGTTGRRKGVHAGIHDQVWGARWLEDEHAAFDHRHGDTHLVVSPLYHSGPFRHALVTALRGGRLAVLPGFDVAGWCATLRTARPSSMFCVPTHLHRLLAAPEDHADLLASLTLLAHAGAPCPVPLKEQLLAVAPEGAAWEFYGSTEGQFTTCPPDEWRAAPGTVGSARAGQSLEVRDEAGLPLGPGEVGTVWAHVPEHARFVYWGDPDRTARAWDDDAFTVGDLGHLDADGRLFLDGRPGDLVITGGVNVYPAEVERALLEQPGVAEAVVFGVPDEDWGERLVAAVVAWPGATLDGDGLRQDLATRVSRAKVPKVVRVVDELPRTATGKVRRTGDALAALLDGGGPR